MSDEKNKKPQQPSKPKEGFSKQDPRPSGWIGESKKQQGELNKAYELKPKTPPKPKENK